MFVGKVEGEEGEQGVIDAWQFGGVGVSSPRRVSGSREGFFGLPLGSLVHLGFQLSAGERPFSGMK